MIITARTVIRPYTEADIERIAPVLSDPLTMRFWPQPLTPEQIKEWVRRSIRSFAAQGLGRMLVEQRATGVVIGDCGIVYTEINGQQEHDLGYIIHHPFWRQGYALECSHAVLEDGIQRLGLRRLVANMACDHSGSIRVAERLGMLRETEFHNPRNRGIRTYVYAFNLA